MHLTLKRQSSTPLHVQITQQLRECILKGVIPEGGRLPPTRSLAQVLRVNRNTVTQAYNTLWSEGLVEGQVGRGTIVRHSSEQKEGPVSPLSWEMVIASHGDALEHEVGELVRLFAREDLISFAAGLPAPDLYPIEEVAEIARDLLVHEGRTLLQWCAVEGYLPLRQFLGERIPGLSSRNVLVLSGSTEGLYLLAHILLGPGDSVVVEAPTYLGALQTFRAAGARLIGIPIEREGMDLEMLENVLARTSPKFIYTLPTFQNPTGFTMSLERRRKLLALAHHYRVPVVEDDPYGLLRYGGEALPSLRALDTHGYVIYLSTFSKILFPGLRVGWLAAPERLFKRLVSAKYLLNLFTNSLSQAVIAQFWQRGLLDQHLQKVCRVYRERRDRMIKVLGKYCEGISVAAPEGGYSLWPKLPEGVAARTLLQEALQERISFVIGEVFYSDGRGQDRIRLNFTAQPPEQIEEGIKRLGRALKRVRRKRVEEETREEAFIKPIV